jgi:predicted DNA-binding protein
VKKKISTTLYLTLRQRDLLAALSKATRVPQSEYVREGIDAVIKQENEAIARGVVLVRP